MKRALIKRQNVNNQYDYHNYNISDGLYKY